MFPGNHASVESLSRYDKDMTIFFFALAVEANLKRYIEHKLATKPHLIERRSFSQRPILDRALRPPPRTWRTCTIDPDMIRLLLTQGADPNEELTVYGSRRASNEELTMYKFEHAWTTAWAPFQNACMRPRTAKFAGLPC